MLTPAAAWRRVADHLAPLPPHRVSRARAAGRVLAGPLAASVDMPQADVSAMDGYAVAGPAAAGDTLPVRGTAAAGAPDRALRLARGEAAKIMTGAVVPAGADRVIPVEQTDGGAARVTLDAVPAEGAHIRRRGEVVRRGDPLLAAGTPLSPGAISLLAAHGHAEVPVHRPPSVATLITGDEVVPADTEPGPGQLRDSNSAFLAAALAGLGLEAEHLGIAADDRDRLRALVARGLERDVLLLTGGVSMGEYDFVEDILSELGCERLVDAVAIQPGKPLVIARHAGGWVFGLPGNPGSVMVTYWLFARPLLRRLLGHPLEGYWHGALRAELAGPLPGAKGKDRFFAARIAFRAGRLLALPVLPEGSHDVAAYARGSALVRVPADAPPAEAGDPCEILPLAEWPGEEL